MSFEGLHIYTTNSQPLTRWKDIHIGRWHRTDPRNNRYRCLNCGKRRQARHLRIKVYYDTLHVFCDGKCPKKAKRAK